MEFITNRRVCILHPNITSLVVSPAEIGWEAKTVNITAQVFFIDYPGLSLRKRQ